MPKAYDITVKVLEVKGIDRRHRGLDDPPATPGLAGSPLIPELSVSGCRHGPAGHRKVGQLPDSGDGRLIWATARVNHLRRDRAVSACSRP